ncbi:uncharacterized protein [Haliotis cracherodii]|uniref:uncharacterized protein n=1 Tax=Haliotis cracherodii TaxID=6455 RepID=UPI0039EC3926
MEFARDSQLVCVCLLLMFGGVLAKSLTSLELESPCPREWLYVGSQRCAYVIPSDIPNRELNIFCQVQFESQFLLLEDKPVCIKSSEDDNLIYAPEDLETSQASRRNRLFKRVFGNAGIGR